MRFEDVTDYVRLRRIATNPREIVRFRKGQTAGSGLEVRMRDGGPLFIRGGLSDFHMFHRIYLRDEYRVARYAGSGLQCIVDLGANVGLFAARASELARRVIACEPLPVNVERLRMNLAARPNVTIVAEAVAAEAGTIRIFSPVDARRTGSYSSFPEEEGAFDQDSWCDVPAITLEQLFEREGIERCDLLKIDIEGHEYDLLGTAPEEILARIDRIHGEYHDIRPDDPATRIASFSALLADRGFAVDVVPHRRKENFGMFFATRPGGKAGPRAE